MRTLDRYGNRVNRTCGSNFGVWALVFPFWGPDIMFCHQPIVLAERTWCCVYGAYVEIRVIE